MVTNKLSLQKRVSNHLMELKRALKLYDEINNDLLLLGNYLFRLRYEQLTVEGITLDEELMEQLPITNSLVKVERETRLIALAVDINEAIENQEKQVAKMVKLHQQVLASAKSADETGLSSPDQEEPLFLTHTISSLTCLTRELVNEIEHSTATTHSLLRKLYRKELVAEDATNILTILIHQPSINRAKIADFLDIIELEVAP